MSWQMPGGEPPTSLRPGSGLGNAGPIADGFVVAGVFPRLVAYGVDTLLLGQVNLGVLGGLGLLSESADASQILIVSAVLIAVEFGYFVGSWTSRLQATLGMRLVGLRVAAVGSARAISANDAILRWIALSGALSIIGIVPRIPTGFATILSAWLIALLISTVIHPLRQGFHDRWARSVVVQPAPGGSRAAIITFLLVAVLLFVVLPIAIVAVAGDQVRDILSQIGASVR